MIEVAQFCSISMTTFLPLLDSPWRALVVLAIACVVTLVCTPFVRALAWRYRALSFPDARRTHAEPMAQWGGVAIFVGVSIAALVWRAPSWEDFRLLAPSASVEDIRQTAQTVHLSTYFFGCGLLMLFLGMADDKYELSPLLKVLGQLLIAGLLWSGGFRINTLPFSEGLQLLNPATSFVLTTLWILALTNGINFIDGVDGLATGVCAIAAGSLCVLETVKNAPWAATAAAAVCGACLGFLRWNKHPARIYLGDSGALLLGFWLAAIALAAASKTAAATTLALPLLVLGVPIVDVLWAVVRRTLAHQAPWRADRGHLHHRLLARGLSPQKTVLVIYAFSAALGLVAVLWALRG